MPEEDKAAPPPKKYRIGVPEGVDPEKVAERAAVMIANGTNPMLAEKLAIDAEQAQVHRDAAFKKLDETRKAGKAKAEAEARAAAKKGGN